MLIAVCMFKHINFIVSQLYLLLEYYTIKRFHHIITLSLVYRSAKNIIFKASKNCVRNQHGVTQQTYTKKLHNKRFNVGSFIYNVLYCS